MFSKKGIRLLLIALAAFAWSGTSLRAPIREVPTLRADGGMPTPPPMPLPGTIVS